MHEMYSVLKIHISRVCTPSLISPSAPSAHHPVGHNEWWWYRCKWNGNCSKQKEKQMGAQSRLGRREYIGREREIAKCFFTWIWHHWQPPDMEWHVNCACGVRLKYANWSGYEHRTDLQNFKMQTTKSRKKNCQWTNYHCFTDAIIQKWLKWTLRCYPQHIDRFERMYFPEFSMRKHSRPKLRISEWVLKVQHRSHLWWGSVLVVFTSKLPILEQFLCWQEHIIRFLCTLRMSLGSSLT